MAVKKIGGGFAEITAPVSLPARHTTHPPRRSVDPFSGMTGAGLKMSVYFLWNTMARSYTIS